MDQQTHEFIDTLFADIPEGLFGYVWTSRGDAKATFSFADTEQGLRLLQVNGNGRDCYAGVALTRGVLARDRRAENATAAARIALVLDVDADGADKRPRDRQIGEPEQIERHPRGTDEAEEVVRRVTAALVAPSLVVASGGGGFHLWWVLREPCLLDGEGAREHVAGIARRWHKACRAAAGYALDSVSDLARILRVPGTTNHKRDPVAPVTLVSTGPKYDFADLADLLPAEDPRPQREKMPAALPTMDGTNYAKAALASITAEVANAPMSDRNNALFKGAARLGQFIAGGQLPEADVRRHLLAAATTNGLVADDGAHSVERTIDSGLNAGAQNPELPLEVKAMTKTANLTQPPASTATSWHRTEMGTAERFAAMHRGRVLWCPDLGKWLLWDGARWAVDDTDSIVASMKQTVQALYAEIGMITGRGEDEDAREADRRKQQKDAFKWAQQCERRNVIRAVLDLAHAEPGMAARITDFDADGWLLNVQNGTVDLRTGALRPHRPEDLCRKLAPVTYDPAATAPTWEAFLQRIMAGNESMIEFLGRAVGASLPEHTREQVLLILHGQGANGKSTFVRTILALLGDYGNMAEPQTIMARKHDDGIRNDLATLCGARMVATTETAEGRRLDEGLVKRLTGGDALTARYLFREFFTFTPGWRTWLATNHRPEVRGTDWAIWRRLRLVPFGVVIPDEEQDKAFDEKLKAELSGILNWALNGCLSWQANGLAAPDEVTTATAEYREDEDAVGGFLRDCCIEHNTAEATTGDLWGAYQRWCEAEGEKPMTQTAFSRRLGERGYTRDRQKRNGVAVRLWQGVGLVDETHN